MLHEMKLRPGPFAAIASGHKTFELRLHDEKRRLIAPGDEIVFCRTTDGAQLHAAVLALHPFASFAALYRALPLTACGYTEKNAKTASPKDMEAYYSPEEQSHWGVLAIEIRLCRHPLPTTESPFSARLVGEGDLPALLRLAKGNPQYYAPMGITPTHDSLRQSMHALPKGKSPEDKAFFGWFDGDTLIAVTDLIFGYPDEKTAFVGWFMVDAARQRQGLGTRLVQAILRFLAQEGFYTVRLGRVEGNAQSERFWQRQGFVPTGASYETDGYTVIVMEKLLT